MTAPAGAALRHQLTNAHSDAQAVVAGWVAAQMARVWPSLNPERLDETSPLWVRLAMQVIQPGRELSAMIAGAWHEADRAVALGTEDAEDAVDAVDVFSAACRELNTRTGRRLPATVARFARRARRTDVSADRLRRDPPELIAAEVRTSLIVTGPITVKRTQDVNRAERRATRAAQRHALGAGRDLVMDAIRSDPRAPGWIRVPDADACAFCLMLASRGPVYKAESAATYRSKGGKNERYHDGCGCQVRPMYSRDEEWPEGSRRAADLWDESTRRLGGKDARRAFREAVEA